MLNKAVDSDLHFSSVFVCDNATNQTCDVSIIPMHFMNGANDILSEGANGVYTIV